jgi:hypothetical protein
MRSVANRVLMTPSIVSQGIQLNVTDTLPGMRRRYGLTLFDVYDGYLIR